MPFKILATYDIYYLSASTVSYLLNLSLAVLPGSEIHFGVLRALEPRTTRQYRLDSLVEPANEERPGEQRCQPLGTLIAAHGHGIRRTGQQLLHQRLVVFVVQSNRL